MAYNHPVWDVLRQGNHTHNPLILYALQPLKCLIKRVRPITSSLAHRSNAKLADYRTKLNNWCAQAGKVITYNDVPSGPQHSQTWSSTVYGKYFDASCSDRLLSIL